MISTKVVKKFFAINFEDCFILNSEYLVVLNYFLTFTEPVLPVLGGRLPKSLTESLAGGQFTTTRCNWVIQSSAVDFLHIFLTNMEYFIQKYEIEASYSLSIHDMIQDWLIFLLADKFHNV